MNTDNNLNLAQKLIKSHLVTGEMKAGEEIGLKIDQVLQQDATGTLIMLELEAIGLEKVKAEVAVQYVDHNLLQADFKNADDHLFLQSAAKKFGYWFSRPGNGISHVVHMEHFGVPGKTLLGSDSHTCSGGSLGMLAIGTGGLDVALAAAGKPYYLKMPKVWGIRLTGQLSQWVSAKDIILELLRRYDVKGGVGYIIEYFGPGLNTLSAWDRHVIANMGAELGATASVFPSDLRTREFLEKEKRAEDWQQFSAGENARYDRQDELDLDVIEPLIAYPSSPGNVVPVKEVEGRPVSQVVVGSSANPGLRDFWIVGEMVKGRTISPDISLDINPSSREVIQTLGVMGSFVTLIESGARFHQTGCMGCIGMGQAPATGKISLRTVPRNFPGRSGTLDDQVYLCSPETAAASAVTGKITDPRDFADKVGLTYPEFREPEYVRPNFSMLLPPEKETKNIQLEKGPNIKTLPDFSELPDSFEVPVILKMGNNISTDEILKAGADALPLRSNIEEISKFAYLVIDSNYYKNARSTQDSHSGHIVIGGENYAQGSSREHAALAPRYLGQKAVIALSYARIGWQNLINFGIIPFEFSSKDDYNSIDNRHILKFANVRIAIEKEDKLTVLDKTTGKSFTLKFSLSKRQRKILLAGGMINYLKKM